MKTCTRCKQTKALADFGKNNANPDKLQYHCRECERRSLRERRDYFAKRREEKHEQIRAQVNERYRTDAEHRERRKQYERERRQRPEMSDHDRKRHYKRWADPEYRKAYVAKRRERRHRDPEYRRKVYHWRRARQARIQLQGKPFTHAEWIALCERYDHRCLCCGERKPLSPDHVVPVSRGGSSDIENIQPLCVDCNKRKNARTTDYRTQV